MIVLTIGTFDLLHRGHLRLLRRACGLGDLTVGVNSDDFAASFKARPIQTERERMLTISELPFASDVALNEDGGRTLIRRVQPDVLVVGSDWATRDYFKQIEMTLAELETIGCGLCYLPYTPGVSTSDLRRRIKV